MFSKGVRYMIVATMAFSLMQVGVKYLSHIPFHELILFRSGISLVLSLAFLLKTRRAPFGRNKPLLIQRGIYGTIALSLMFLSIQNLPLASAATLSYLSPIFTALIAVFFLKERLRPMQLGFFALSFFGVVLIRGFSGDVQGIYVLAAVVAAFFAGMAYNLVRKLRSTDHPVVVVFYFPLVATPIMAVWSALDWVQPVGWDWAILIGIGILTQIGQVWMSKALQMEEAGRITSIKYLGTVNALLFSVFLFHETYSLVNLAGIGLVIAGVLLNIYFTKQRSAQA